ncbi:hypothetical protein A2661_01345 [Candidatus Giovannonibacteria bacterium RIFCSPHIGHO2_01_FULL_45_24]|uniref:PEGA domain-containing protein n=1 Tax=Candidatus Giovannonibacteria bacterium RIFCSPLOWO2_01_FULL_46_32 TaxID=1798353 RepID=A0A1F5XHH8_9BACT|nr:MAG: hypothetical protein A2661_01345 [Candidatus Giovannonibacteria bacterium RIFCSPHIGHO2_01_FULL_45_24]OGF87340.1 MAG: hypothetical protein A3B19_03940 [Candidatus Giovannonibacteria bacterium RIFCSPLOWO2_01_FULL_46_32]
MLTKRKRRVFFYISIFVFLFAALPIIFYSQGYRLGEDFALHKTGGVFIRTSESGALVRADKKNKQTSLINKSALVKNLLPGDYQISAEKEGFWPWSKRIEVLPEIVAERNALLVPKSPNMENLGTTSPRIEIPKPPYPSIKKFWEIPTTRDFIVLGEDGNFYKNRDNLDISGLWGATTYNILKSNKSSFFDENFLRIIYWDAHSIDAYWFGDFGLAPKWQKARELHVFYSDSELADARFYPGWEDYLIVVSGDGIYTLEMDASGGQNIAPLYKGEKPKIVFMDKEIPALVIFDSGQYIRIKL